MRAALVLVAVALVARAYADSSASVFTFFLIVHAVGRLQPAALGAIVKRRG